MPEVPEIPCRRRSNRRYRVGVSGSAEAGRRRALGTRPLAAAVTLIELLCVMAIIGILMAIPIAYTSNPDVLAVAEAWRPGQWAGLAVLSGIGYWLYRVATRHAPTR